MYVCVDDAGEPRIVGWTSATCPPDGRKTVRVAHLNRLPNNAAANVLFIDSEITQHEFATRHVFHNHGEVASGLGECVVLLRDGDDPAVLPDWRPLQERPIAVLARSRASGADVVLSQVDLSDIMLMVQRSPWPLPGGVDDGRSILPSRHCPQFWAETEFGGVAMHPPASDEYEITVRRERRFTFRQRWPYLVPHDLTDAARGAVRQMMESEAMGGFGGGFWTTAAPPDGPGLTAEMVRQQCAALRAMQNAAPPAHLQQYAAHQAYAAQQAQFLGNPLGLLGAAPPPLWPQPIFKPPDPAAVTRARGLLRRLLSPAQWRELENEGRITERIDGREYVVRPGEMIEVRADRGITKVRRLLWRADGKNEPMPLVERWCVNPSALDGDAKIPSEDMAIAQLLHLRADPATLRRAANVFPVMR